MGTIKIGDIHLVYGCDLNKEVFEDVPISEVRFFIFKANIGEDESGKFCAGYVYAVDPKNRVKCYDMFGQWRYSFRDTSIDMGKVVELNIEDYAKEKAD